MSAAGGYLDAFDFKSTKYNNNTMIDERRIRTLNDKPVQSGRYVLYWMQASQRTEFNHALEYAVKQANDIALPLLVVFVVIPDFPEANLRHYDFMIQGLAEVERSLVGRGIAFQVQVGQPGDIIKKFCSEASMVVTDCGYLRFQRQWRGEIAGAIKCKAVQVESDVVVPVEIASQKEEYSAGTFRPKISRHIEDFLVPLRKVKYRQERLKVDDNAPLGQVLEQLNLDRSVEPTPWFTGAFSKARERLRKFIATGLADYADKANDPSLNIRSELSPYLHFGQISPIDIALQVSKSEVAEEAKSAFLEQLIVRRELAVNFVYYSSEYDSYDCIPNWAEKTLAEHMVDERPVIYNEEQLERGVTEDPYWNAAQLEMVQTGIMHNYMRMYWGKKVLEWTRNPAEAFDILIRLNNKYELDGRDPNSYAGVAWCFGKHDRAWGRRPVFGKVRYMSASGLKRKFKIDNYVSRVKKQSEVENE